MTEEKIKKLTVAVTVCSVVLLFVLLSVLIYQWIAISVKKNQLKEHEEEIQRYEQLIEDANDDLTLNKEDWVIQKRARELGYKFPSDVDITD